MAKKEKKIVKKAKKKTYRKSTLLSKIKKEVQKGIIYIQTSFNNTHVSVCDQGGNVLLWESAGTLGFKGTKKATPYAATMVIRKVIDKAKDIGLKEAEVRVKGVGTGRDSAIRALATSGLDISAIKDVTPLPFGGPRPRKVRRV